MGYFSFLASPVYIVLSWNTDPEAGNMDEEGGFSPSSSTYVIHMPMEEVFLGLNYSLLISSRTFIFQ